MFAAWLQKRWYQTRPAPCWLRPLSALFTLIAKYRRNKYSRLAWQAPVPIIVIGNIAVGGTGKTPLVVTLLHELKAAGFSPAVISRGYGGSERGPLVLDNHTPADVGDEPVLIAARTGCPVAIGSQRCDVIKTLLEAHPAVNVILSDDGLQHYKMARDVECVVMDGARGLGNQSCLPAGPLRETPARLTEVAHIVVNGELRYDLPQSLDLSAVAITKMNLSARYAINLKTGERRPLADFAARQVHAVAGIGNPQRFFDTLSRFSINAECHSFSDHHPYSLEDLAFGDEHPVLMTEKDAVKCNAFTQAYWWYVPVDAVLEGPLVQQLIEALQ